MPISANFGKICPNISLWIASAGIKHFLDQGMFEFFLEGGGVACLEIICFFRAESGITRTS